jgi:replicative DNA helicase
MSTKPSKMPVEGPSEPATEAAVLGCVLIQRDAMLRVAALLGPSVWADPRHVLIWVAVEAMWAERTPIDLLTLTQELRKRGTLDQIGGAYYLTELTSRVASAANIEFYARILVERSITRGVIRVANNLLAAAADPTTDCFDLIEAADKQIIEIGEKALPDTRVAQRDSVLGAIKHVENIATGRVVHGKPTGFPHLDEILYGLAPGELVVVGARPSQGKSAFALSIARNVAGDGTPVYFATLEMTEREQQMRMLSAETGISIGDLQHAKSLPTEAFTALNKAGQVLASLPIEWDDAAGTRLSDLRIRCMSWARHYNVAVHGGVVIVDYLQLMQGEDKRASNREGEVAAISRGLKQMAKELGVTVIALSQLSRDLEKRGNDEKKPRLSDLRESGSIEQDASKVVFLFRPFTYGLIDQYGKPYEPWYVDAIVAKHRNGPLGTKPLNFIGQLTKFESMGSHALPQRLIPLSEPAPKPSPF